MTSKRSCGAAILLLLGVLLAPLSAAAQTLRQIPGCAQWTNPPSNPRLERNFPDPFVLRIEEGWLAYSTTSGGRNVQVACSPDLETWANARAEGSASLWRDAMPVSPRWSVGGGERRPADVWAPEVMRIGDRYVMYFSARHATLTQGEGRPRRQCLGAAVSARPEGPFEAEPAPLACEAYPHGLIDPSPFRDADGRLYLLFKTDGNCCDAPTRIVIQPLAANGLSLTGAPADLLVSDAGPWEHGVAEAPTLVRRGAGYVLLYSGGHFGHDTYAVGHARCASLTSRCEKRGTFLSTSKAGENVVGPGHQALTEKEGRTYIVYHAHGACAHGPESTPERFLYVDRLDWNDDAPGLPAPSAGKAFPYC